MSEQDPNVRRVTRRDRKRRIEPRGPLFSSEDDLPAAAVDPAAPAASEPSAPAERFPPLPGDSGAPAAPSAAAKPARRPRSACLPNLVALLFFVAAIGLLVVFIIIGINPYTPLNPFPPFTPLPILITTTPLPPTATLPPSATPSPTAGPTATFTPLPITPASAFPFGLAPGGVVYVPNGNGQGCNWSSIAGSVTDLNGAPLDGYLVRVSGDNLDQTVTTGATLTFGSGGFEMPLGETPRQASYFVQLLSPDSQPLSDWVPVATRADCEGNVAIISFVQRPA